MPKWNLRLNRGSRTVAALLLSASMPPAFPAWPALAADLPVRDGMVADVRVTGAWIRWLPAGLPGAGYMVLTNTGPAAWVLRGATSPAYARIEFHRTQSANGMSAMSPVAAVELQPHASVVFGEGGYHLMLMQPIHPVHPGEQVPVVLEFAGGRTLTVSFVVRGSVEAAQ